MWSVQSVLQCGDPGDKSMNVMKMFIQPKITITPVSSICIAPHGSIFNPYSAFAMPSTTNTSRRHPTTTTQGRTSRCYSNETTFSPPCDSPGTPYIRQRKDSTFQYHHEFRSHLTLLYPTFVSS